MTALNVHLSLSLLFSSILILGFATDPSARKNSGAVVCLIYALIQAVTAALILNP